MQDDQLLLLESGVDVALHLRYVLKGLIPKGRFLLYQLAIPLEVVLGRFKQLLLLLSQHIPKVSELLFNVVLLFSALLVPLLILPLPFLL